MREKTMSEDWLARQFESHRPRLWAAAYRMLGTHSDADDAVQEAWLRLSFSRAEGIDNLGAWLTTVVGRVCLNMLRSRRMRREVSPVDDASEPVAADDPERDAALADSVGLALLVVLEALNPAERVAFVLHDMFDLPFEEIAPIVGRSPAATRQLASRARRRVQGEPPTAEADRARQREVVGAFLAAARGNDFSALLAVLDPNVVLHADAAAVAASLARVSTGAPALAPEVYGSAAVANTFKGRAQAAQLALIAGDVGLVFTPGGRPMAVFDFVVENGRIVEISLIADAGSIA